eukprot:TRINITY_DN6962_c0_g1_i1.p1 TRINITY_DN6962_c0_g1~~TRINITY_DN6962_c0_g1_i1.p1  ORF type:complete len:362 (+),score=112.71 TRINITY_DN6962_c0_g1_i1:139-1086(+)
MDRDNTNNDKFYKPNNSWVKVVKEEFRKEEFTDWEDYALQILRSANNVQNFSIQAKYNLVKPEKTFQKIKEENSTKIIEKEEISSEEHSKLTAKITNEIKPGTILISHPLMLFDIWRNSMILITKHDPSGTEGIIFNKSEGSSLNHFFGGPVLDTPRPHFLLNRLGPEEVKGSKELGKGKDSVKGLYVSLRTKDEIDKSLLSLPNKSSFKMISGFCSWFPKQLDKELKSGCWWSAEISRDLLFSFKDKEAQWEYVMRKMGEEYSKIADFMPFILYFHKLSQKVGRPNYSNDQILQEEDEEEGDYDYTTESDNDIN